MKNIDFFMEHPHEAQERVFKDLISKGKNTEWGKKYEYNNISTAEKFSEKVPVSPYETLFPYIERIMKGEQNILWPSDIKWFSKSSGTTNAKSKFIPVSTESLHDCHFKGGKDLLALYFNAHPESKLFSGKGLAMGGTYFNNPLRNNSYCGDVSAVIMANLPVWAQYVRTPDIKTALMDEWESKIEKIAHKTINQNVTNIAGVPTWTIVLLEKILQLTGKSNILEVWPNFEVFYHGAVSFTPYREIFKKFFPSKVLYFESYNASEGFFGMQDRLKAEDMLLMLDYGIFYEFIPEEYMDSENPKVLQLHEVEIEKNYALVISTNGGLWRYKIGDTIKFTSLSPYRIRVSGRTKHFINAFGEEIIIENAEVAIAEAGKKTGAIITEFTAAPIYLDNTNKGGHEWVIEFSQEPDNLQDFAKCLDNTLKDINSDYEAKRHKDLALQMPVVHKAPSGTFYNWMKKRGKLGGQHKVPRLYNTREYIDDILQGINPPALKNK
jgi:hypothetical protein